MLIQEKLQNSHELYTSEKFVSSSDYLLSSTRALSDNESTEGKFLKKSSTESSHAKIMEQEDEKLIETTEKIMNGKNENTATEYSLLYEKTKSVEISSSTEQESDSCLSTPNPCHNNGKCTSDHDRSHICECLQSFTGNECETKVDDCLSSPCANGSTSTCMVGDLMWHCNCNPGYTGEYCDEDIDECDAEPCLNKGTCTNTIGDYQCSCLAAFEGENCEIALTNCIMQTKGAKLLRMLMVAAQTLSSIYVIIVLSVLVGIFIVLGEFSTERILHMGEELTLIAAHLLIMLFRTPVVGDAVAFCDSEVLGNLPKIEMDSCRTVGAALHYLFSAHFAFLLLEALNNYTVGTCVVNGVSFLSRTKNILLSCGIPLLLVAFTSIFWWHHYGNDTTCWSDLSLANFCMVVLPCSVMAVLATVVSESTSVTVYFDHPNSVREHRNNAFANSSGALLIVPFSFAAWFVGMNAVNSTNLTLYSTASILNLILVSLIVLFHTLGNEKARALLGKILCCCGCRNQGKVFETIRPVAMDIKTENSECSAQENEEFYDVDQMIRNAVSKI